MPLLKPYFKDVNGKSTSLGVKYILLFYWFENNILYFIYEYI